MTADTTALQERIAEALAEHWRRKHSTLLTSGPCSGCSRVAADAVAAELQAAKAEALRDAAGDIAWSAETLPHMTPHDAARGLVRRADRIETGDQR